MFHLKMDLRHTDHHSLVKALIEEYSVGISGNKILKGSRVLKVADTIEAMVTERPYRSSWSLKKALVEITVNKGIIYDADVVDACLRVFNERGFQFK